MAWIRFSNTATGGVTRAAVFGEFDLADRYRLSHRVPRTSQIKVHLCGQGRNRFNRFDLLRTVFRAAAKCLSLMFSGGLPPMRSRVRKVAHLLERMGLALAGAAGGLLVAAHVGSSIAMLTSQGFILVMMIFGASGFYLGIDTPPLPFHGPQGEPSGAGSSDKVDSAELLSAVGTFLATLAVFVSISVIVFREQPHISLTLLIMLGFTVGVTMQIVAGAIARTRA
jgi:hypothetical protein